MPSTTPTSSSPASTRGSWAGGPGRWGSEAPFAARDGSTGETDGYLVSFVNDEAEGRGEINVFDASDVAAGPLARVLLPVRVPSGFHATWVRADQLQARA